ncbi:MAG: matrixin family metalloprotease [Deltaproteobacteria bacterium]|nr:matrixin family metalloprotease [Deltaproteobacteria bacterium]
MSASRLCLIGLALPCAGFAVIRDPLTLAPIKWPSAAVSISIQADGAGGITDGSDLVAIRAALTAWGQPACAAFGFVDAGLSSTGGSTNDGVNRISFLTSWTGPAGVVALTEQRRDTGVSPQQWLDADITVNEQDFVWATNGDPEAYDVLSVLTHELGHVVGLAHGPSPEATMYWGYSEGLTLDRTLSDDDIRGVCYLYPAAATLCSTDGDCPLFMGGYFGGTDVRTHCVPPDCVTGAVGFGGACFASADCSSGACYTGLDQAPGTAPGFCTQSCNVSSPNCPAAAYCRQDVMATRGALCHVGYADCVLDADCGGTNWYCVRDLDGKFRCRRTCVQDSHCSAVPGTICHGGAGAGNPGLCRPPGPAADGQPCTHSLECASLYCGGTGAVGICTHNAWSIDSGPAADGRRGDGGADGGPPPGDAGPGGEAPAGGDATGAAADHDVLVGGCACHAPGLGTPVATAALGVVAATVRCRARRRGVDRSRQTGAPRCS